MVSVNFILTTFFYLGLFAILYLNRTKFVRHGVLLMRKTKVGLGLMKRLGKHKTFWKIYSTIAIPTAVILMVWGGSLIFMKTVDLVSGATDLPAVDILIPGVRFPGSQIYVPLIYGIISIAVLALVHEFSHGVVAISEGVKIKSSGWGFFLILPLAFVELDEKKLFKMRKLSRMRILAAGAFANVLLFAVIFGILSLISGPFVNYAYLPSNVSIVGITPDAPADLAGLDDGMVIKSVDGYAVENTTYVVDLLKSHSPEDIVSIETDKGVYSLALGTDSVNSSKAYAGFFLMQNYKESDSAFGALNFLVPVIMWFFGLFSWIAFINFGVGVLNFFPIWILDGGYISFDIISSIFKNKKVAAGLFNLVASFFFGMIFFNLCVAIFLKFKYLGGLLF